MNLKVARLCLDCEELHTAEQCPVCASEAFAYLSNWLSSYRHDAKGEPRRSAVTHLASVGARRRPTAASA